MARIADASGNTITDKAEACNEYVTKTPGDSQSVAYTGTAGTISNALNSRGVRVVVTSAGFVKIAPSPTATTTDIYMPANVPEYFACNVGDKVSAIQLSSGGTLYVTEMK